MSSNSNSFGYTRTGIAAVSHSSAGLFGISKAKFDVHQTEKVVGIGRHAAQTIPARHVNNGSIVDYLALGEQVLWYTQERKSERKKQKTKKERAAVGGAQRLRLKDKRLLTELDKYIVVHIHR